MNSYFFRPSRQIVLGFVFLTNMATSVSLAQDTLDDSKSKSLDFLSQIRVLNQNENWTASEEKINQWLKTESAAIDKNKELIDFQKAYVLFKLKKWEDSEKLFLQITQQTGNLKEYAFYFLGQIYQNQSRFVESEKYYKLVDGLNPNLKLKIEAKKSLAQLLLLQKNPKAALQVLKSIEKRSRGTESYPDIVYQLAIAERQAHSARNSCPWINKLYVRFPGYDKIKDWTYDLEKNQFEGQSSLCPWTMSEFKERIRNLLWLGLEDKALAELNHLKTKVGESDKYLADSFLAQYYLQEGEVQKAHDLLKGYFATKKNDFEYLIFYANTSARSGDYNAAVGAYYQAYQLSPRSVQGKKALYQSAFLSYQFQDYDGATRKFQEFMRKFSGSGLKKDAEWHLAWLKYLKADYAGSYKAFLSLQKSSRRMKSNQADRLSYWMAMSLLRQGKSESAKPLFEKLSKDPLLGYYSIAASERLKEIQMTSIPKSRLAYLEIPRRIDRFNTDIFMMPSDDFNSRSESEESEDTVDLTQISSVKSKSSEDSSDSEEDKSETAGGGDQNPAIISAGKNESDDENQVTDFKNPLLAQRFQKARDLQILGLDDWARWDLYEIERKTRNKEYLRTLMSEYSNLKNFHRSSYIAQTYFAQARAHHGIDGIKFMWQEAYPKAYSENVLAASKKFEVPEDLIWGIMKAESQYRADAISPVGALGLMQVMPNTGHKMAKMIGLKDFSARQLLMPPVAIQIGTSYLQRLMKKFNQNSALVAAAYNAGPHRVYSWLNSFGQLQMDEFIEHIPFLETRNYVKKVLTHQQLYTKIYNLSSQAHVKLNDSIKVSMPERVPAKETWDEI